MKTILILGATSAIAQAAARRWALQGHRLFLVGRNAERLGSLAADLRVRGAASVDHLANDLNDFTWHRRAIEAAVEVMGRLDLALIAHGTLADQAACERDFSVALQELNTNAISVISLLTHLANYFETQRCGCIAVISSVAGDRGRQSNYVYGTAKAAVTVFTQGLRNRLSRAGVQVLTIKPGFVDTPMTAAYRKGLLWASPERVAIDIDAAIVEGRDVVYTPGFWLLVMLLIRWIPERIFKRLKL